MKICSSSATPFGDQASWAIRPQPKSSNHPLASNPNYRHNHRKKWKVSCIYAFHAYTDPVTVNSQDGDTRDSETSLRPLNSPKLHFDYGLKGQKALARLGKCAAHASPPPIKPMSLSLINNVILIRWDWMLPHTPYQHNTSRNHYQLISQLTDDCHSGFWVIITV